MQDTDTFYMPRHLDDPARILFWTLDESMVLMGPMICGFMCSMFVTGIGLGIWAYLGWKKLKTSGKVELIQFALYWYLPSFCLNLKDTPPSHQRWYVG